jgi:hypothetical protein
MCEQHPKGLSPAGREKVIQLRDEGLTSSANRKENAAGEYLKRLELGDEEANSFLMTETYLVYETRRTGIKGILYEHLNRAKHMWMWDTQSLSSALLNHVSGAPILVSLVIAKIRCSLQWKMLLDSSMPLQLKRESSNPL